MSNQSNKIRNFRSWEWIAARPMTLPEPGKLGDLDFDQNLENWPPNDPPTPLNVNLTPMRIFFSAQLFKTFLHFRSSLDLVTIPYGEKSLLSLFLGPPEGGKRGVRGQKKFFGSKCLKLPKTSRKVVKLMSKNFQCIYLINT